VAGAGAIAGAEAGGAGASAGGAGAEAGAAGASAGGVGAAAGAAGASAGGVGAAAGAAGASAGGSAGATGGTSGSGGSGGSGGSETTDTVLSLTVGGGHTCVRTSSGHVRCWGWNAYGQLGYGNTKDIGDDETPASAGDVPLGASAVQLALGQQHSCALLEGSVRCWGDNKLAQLGYGFFQNVGDNEPASWAGDVSLTGVLMLAAGAHHTCASTYSPQTDTRPNYCWGKNTRGQLGYGNTKTIGDDETPSAAGPIGWSNFQLSALTAGAEHTCVLVGGGVWCWGANESGQLGYGHTNDIGDDEVPVAKSLPVSLSGSAVQVVAGARHTCALLEGGAVRCWGANESGQLGYGHTKNIGDDELPDTAGEVPLGAPALQIAAGVSSTCALLELGAVRCWGANDTGQLGYGHTNNIGDDETPASAGDVPIGGFAVQVGTGWHTCALLTTGAVRCWGANQVGQLGYGHTNNIGDDETPASVGDVAVF
jgi:alpha-tubulin suppressor-like RCC1 family protein